MDRHDGLPKMDDAGSQVASSVKAPGHQDIRNLPRKLAFNGMLHKITDLPQYRDGMSVVFACTLWGLPNIQQSGGSIFSAMSSACPVTTKKTSCRNYSSSRIP